MPQSVEGLRRRSRAVPVELYNKSLRTGSVPAVFKAAFYNATDTYVGRIQVRLLPQWATVEEV